MTRYWLQATGPTAADSAALPASEPATLARMRSGVLTCGVWLWLCAARQAQVSVATRGPEDVEVRRQLGLWLEVPVLEQPEPAERTPTQIIAETMQVAGPGYLVVL